MKNKIPGLFLLFILLSTAVFAQADKDEKKEERAERKAAAKDRVDYNVFRRQILATKEYSDERHKMQGLQKNTKEPIKVVAYVDSTESEDVKLLTGYIAVNVGDNSTNVYEFKYDRAAKKIATSKPTGETVEIEAEEKPTARNTTAKPASSKKKTDEDEEEDEEEKPSKRKSKDEEE
jgi:hypothetical protein